MRIGVSANGTGGEFVGIALKSQGAAGGEQHGDEKRGTSAEIDWRTTAVALLPAAQM